MKDNNDIELPKITQTDDLVDPIDDYENQD
jgi:hypothetical protein